MYWQVLLLPLCVPLSVVSCFVLVHVVVMFGGAIFVSLFVVCCFCRWTGQLRVMPGSRMVTIGQVVYSKQSTVYTTTRCTNWSCDASSCQKIIDVAQRSSRP